MVGDPNQAIYGWNGADPSLLATLPDRFGGLEVVHLDQNHRCTPQVVAAASAALGTTAVAPPRSAAPDGPLPTVTAFDDDRAEAEAVAARVLSRAEAGMAWSDQAVLARTHDLLAGVRRAFDEVGIPCRFAPAPESPDTEAPGPATGRAAARTRSAGRLDPGGGVELATFHRAKGLEWEAVSVVGLEDGYVPIVHATTPGGPRRGAPAAVRGPDPGRADPRVLVGPIAGHGCRGSGHGTSTVPVVGRHGRRRRRGGRVDRPSWPPRSGSPNSGPSSGADRAPTCRTDRTVGRPWPRVSRRWCR